MQGVLGRLSQVRSRIKRLFLLEGGMRAFSVLAIGMIVLFLMDYYLNLPTPVRMTLLLAFLAYFATIVYRFLLYPLTRRITEQDVAIAVERQFPDLKERLISSIQLSEALETAPDSPGAPNPAMVRSLVQETLATTRNLDFQQAIHPRNLPRVAMLAGAFFLIMAGYSALFPKNVSVFAARIVAREVPYPPKTRVTLLSPADLASAEGAASMVVSFGAQLDIRVALDGKIPSRVLLLYRKNSREGDAVGDEEEPWTQFDMEALPDDPKIYRFATEKLVRGFDFYIKAGDGLAPGPYRSVFYSVHVDYPPRVVNDSIEIDYVYPAYTGLKSKRDRNRMIKAPIGTQVTYSAMADMPVSRAYLKWFKNEDKEEIEIGRAELGMDGNAISGAFTVDQSLRYALILEKTVGESSLSNAHDPLRGSVEAMVDEAPLVNLVEPRANGNVTSQGFIPFELTAKDDYGVNEIRILASIKRKDKSERTPVDPMFLKHFIENPADPANPLPGDTDVPFPAPKIAGKTRYSLRALNLQEGDLVVVQVEAHDNKNGEPNVGRSREFTFTIVSEEVIREEIAKRLADLIRRIETALKQQIEIRKGTFELYAVPHDQQRPLDGNEKLAANKQKTNQHKMSTEYAEIHQGFVAIARLYLMNNIVDSEQLIIDGFAKEFEAIARDLSPLARQQIGDANNLDAVADQAGSLGAAVNTQDQIIDRLNKVLRELNKYADYNDIIRFTRELLKIQQDVNKATQSAASKKIEDR